MKKGCAPASFERSPCSCISRNELLEIIRDLGIGPVNNTKLSSCELFGIISKKFRTDDPRKWPGKAGVIGRRSYRPHKDFLDPYLLTSVDIIKLLQQYEMAYPHFKSFGAVPLDFCKTAAYVCNLSLKRDMVDKGKTCAAIIINTHPSEQAGEHWLLIWVDLRSSKIVLFDSEGQPPPTEIQRFMTNLTKQCAHMRSSHTHCKQLNVVKVPHQAPNTDECGVYCIYFVEQLLRGKPIDAFTGKPNIITNEEMIQFFNTQLFPPNIKHLTPNTLKDIISKEQNMVVLFYAPWCGHCKRFKPEYEKFAHKKKIAKHVHVCALNLDKFPKAIEGTPFEKKIQGFPTVMFCKPNIQHEYVGDRTTVGLVSFAKQFFRSSDSNVLTRWQRALKQARLQGGRGVCRKGTLLYKNTKHIFDKQKT